MNVVRRLMFVIKSVSTPMDLTTVIVDLAIGLLWMKSLAMVHVDKQFISSPLRIKSWISDIDECSEETDRCNQNCHNAVGSYACSCYRGYRLREDRVTCIGIAIYNSLHLIYTNSQPWHKIIIIFQTLMSVLRELTSAIITAITQLEATIVAVVQAIDFTMTTPHVTVS